MEMHLLPKHLGAWVNRPSLGRIGASLTELRKEQVDPINVPGGSGAGGDRQVHALIWISMKGALVFMEDLPGQHPGSWGSPISSPSFRT